MGRVISVFTEKGGVGKTTTTLVLAHGFSCINSKSVLLLDFDETPLLSEVVMGRRHFLEDIRDDSRISEYICQHIWEGDVDPMLFIRQWEGGLKTTKGQAANLSIIPGYNKLQNTENILIGHLISGHFVASTEEAHNKVTYGVKRAILPLIDHFDYILIDAPPRMTHFTRGAIDISDLVITPYEPGVGAEAILSKTAKHIEGTNNGAAVLAMPFENRRYVALPNKIKAGGAYGHNDRIELLKQDHPHLNITLKERGPVTALLQSMTAGTHPTMQEHYGSLFSLAKKLCHAVETHLAERTMVTEAAA